MNVDLVEWQAEALRLAGKWPAPRGRELSQDQFWFMMDHRTGEYALFHYAADVVSLAPSGVRAILRHDQSAPV